MNLPHLQFKLSERLDAQISWQFYNEKIQSGHDFWVHGALVLHDDLRNLETQKNKKKFLADYIHSIYKSNSAEFNLRKEYIENIYLEKCEEFDFLTKKIFKDHKWPKGDYICYPSIFNFCPRFIQSKTFQVFMYADNEHLLFTIFHEMIHFIFFDYTIKKYPHLFKKEEVDKGIFWDISEIFNSIIHSTKEFENLHGQIKSPYYPKHKKYLPHLKKKWKGQENIDEWLISAYEYLNSKKTNY